MTILEFLDNHYISIYILCWGVWLIPAFYVIGIFPSEDKGSGKDKNNSTAA